MSDFAKIIHLSDLHIGHQECGERFHCIVNNVKELKKPEENYVVVVTGDLVEKATDPGNFAEAKAYLDILKSKKYKVLVVPGNHDYGLGWWGSKNCVKEFKDTFYNDPNFKFPYYDSHKNVAFIGLDSMAGEVELIDGFGAQGELGKEQLAKLKKMLTKEGGDKRITDDMKIVIYLHHHVIEVHSVLEPLRKLKDAEALREILEDQTKYRKVDAILYGHRHNGGILNGAIGGIHRIYDGGTATQKDRGNGPTRVIDLNNDDARWDYDAEFLKF